MKRDMDLIRQILLRIEDSDSIEQFLNGDTADFQGVAKHLLLLQEAGLVDGLQIHRRLGLNEVGMTLTKSERLTWQGHDFIDSLRDDSTWNAVKLRLSTVGKHLGSVTFEVIKALAVDVTKQQLGLPT